MGKEDLDLGTLKKQGRPKIDPDPLLGRLDMLLVVLDRCAEALEDLSDSVEVMVSAEAADPEGEEKA